MKSGGIAYLLAEFPSRTETFILKEVISVGKSFPLFIFALKNGIEKTGVLLPELPEAKIQYIPKWTSWKMMLFFPVTQLFSFRDGIRLNLRRIKLQWTGNYIAGQIRQLPVRHIHAHFAGYPAEIARYVSETVGIPFSFTAHAHDIYVHPCNPEAKIKAASFVSTCTEYNKKWMNRLAPTAQNKIHLIYHGVDLDKWPYQPPLPVAKEAVRILSIGRLVEKKGFLYLLDAIRQLKEKGYRVQLSIVGEGKEKRKLDDYCRRHDLRASVHFPGWQTPEQIRQWHDRSDIFVMPSIITGNGDRDGIPNVILEAMATGLPVISTSISGIPEVIQHHYNGLLVSEKNSAQLYQSISYLTDHPGLRVQFAENARRTVEQRFDHRQGNARLKELFESELKKTPV
jgi:glycosyltransferase involved in cell wall biosynthesis